MVLKRTMLVDDLERRTKSRIGIDTDDAHAFGKYNEQGASPLFSTLPRELRDLVWAYSTAPYEDEDEKFENTAYYFRPGHTARLRTDTALLLTCRRIWLEANAMPMLQAEHSFYYHRPAPDKREPKWMAGLTDLNRQNFGHLHMFAQMVAIEPLNASPGMLQRYFLQSRPGPGDFQPRMLHVTLRHTDWWWWESEQPLRLQDSWVQALLDSPDLRSTETLKLELETLDYKVGQLEPILERIKGMESKEMETHLIDGRPIKTKFVLTGEPRTYEWEGPSNIDKQTFEPYKGKSTLKYHVVTLTWKLRFPDIPSAFIPALRRAPRVVPENSDTWVYPDTAGAMESMYVAGGLDQRRLMHHRRRRLRSPGLSPRQWAQDFAMKQHVHREINTISRKQADLVHYEMRERFEGFKWVGLAQDLTTRWEAEKSLLKFLDG